MVDWTSSESMANQGRIIKNIDFILFGVMLWEVITTLKTDYDIFRREFKWPTVIYAGTKLGALLFIVLVNVTEYRVHLNCQVSGDMADLAARFAMAGASAIFMLRAIALWNRDPFITIPLILGHIGQWGLYLHNVFIVKEHWGDTGSGEGCVIATVTWGWLKIQFIYTMVFDFAVMALVMIALIRLSGVSSLWKILFLDGLGYYVFAFAFYLACTIVAYGNWSVLLAFMISDIATVIVAIAACRSFVRLYTNRAGDSSSISQTPQPISTTFKFARPVFSRSKSSGGTVAVDSMAFDDNEHIRTLPRLLDDPIRSPVTRKFDDMVTGRDVEAQVYLEGT